jgi:hypothetical protein
VVWNGLVPHVVLVVVATGTWNGRGKVVNAAGSVTVRTVHGWLNHDP